MNQLKYALLFVMSAGLVSGVAAQSSVQQVDLQTLFGLADQNNRSLKILNNQHQSTVLAIKEQQNKLLPTINAALNVSLNGDGYIMDRNFSNGFSVPIPGFGNNFVLEAQQIIYAGGAINTEINMAKTNADIFKMEVDKTRQNIRFGIVGYYLEILKLNNQILIIDQNRSLTLKMIDQISAKNEQGVSLKTNITRYKLQLESLNLSRDNLNNRKQIFNNELVNMLQLPMGTTLELDPVPETDQQSIDNWRDLGIENAITLKQKDLEISQAQHSEILVKSATKPQVYAFAGNYLNGPIMIEIPVINKNFNNYQVGVGVKYNISSLYKNNVKKQQAEIAMTTALEAKIESEEKLAKEIENAKINYKEAINVYNIQLKKVQLATENYSIIKNRYLNQLALITEMMDAENVKIDAELQQANAQINILFQYYQLKKITNTL